MVTTGIKLTKSEVDGFNPKNVRVSSMMRDKTIFAYFNDDGYLQFCFRYTFDGILKVDTQEGYKQAIRNLLKYTRPTVSQVKSWLRMGAEEFFWLMFVSEEDLQRRFQPPSMLKEGVEV